MRATDHGLDAMSFDTGRRRVLGAGASLLALSAAGCATPPSPGPAINARATSARLADPFFTDLEQRTFRYFWDTTPHATGHTPDRWPGLDMDVSVAAIGFALSAYPIGVARGWIGRDEAVQRVRNTLRWFRDAPQGSEPRGRAGYKGFFYHYLDRRDGARFGLSELSTADTSLLLLGALHCREFFAGSDAAETDLRNLADGLYAATDWEWARNGGRGIPYQWHPEHGHDPINWSGYDEGMFIYLLAMGSPTSPIPGDCWQEYTRTYDTKSGGFGGRYGPPHLQFAPQFGHQFTQCWVDMRGMKDAYMRALGERGINYFENSRRATHAQRAYAIANPRGWKDYGPDIWGFSACDGPANAKATVDGREREFFAYTGRGTGVHDDGTIAPMAAGGSVAFAPEIALPALRAMHAKYGELVYGRYGFVDAFNPSFELDVPLAFGRVVPGRGWFDSDYIAIDQGPILMAFANLRDEGVWSVMRRAPWLKRGLKAAGFQGGWIEG